MTLPKIHELEFEDGGVEWKAIGPGGSVEVRSLFDSTPTSEDVRICYFRKKQQPAITELQILQNVTSGTKSQREEYLNLANFIIEVIEKRAKK